MKLSAGFNVLFSEPPAGKTDSDKEKDEDEIDHSNEVTELIITADGEQDVDDKRSRPCSGEVQSPAMLVSQKAVCKRKSRDF